MSLKRKVESSSTEAKIVNLIRPEKETNGLFFLPLEQKVDKRIRISLLPSGTGLSKQLCPVSTSAIESRETPQKPPKTMKLMRWRARTFYIIARFYPSLFSTPYKCLLERCALKVVTPHSIRLHNSKSLIFDRFLESWVWEALWIEFKESSGNRNLTLRWFCSITKQPGAFQVRGKHFQTDGDQNSLSIHFVW